MTRRRHPRKKRKPRPKGFSQPGHRQLWDIMLRPTGIQGRKKREFFNALSARIALLSAGVIGLMLLVSKGFIAGFLGFIISFGVIAALLEKGRFIR